MFLLLLVQDLVLMAVDQSSHNDPFCYSWTGGTGRSCYEEAWVVEETRAGYMINPRRCEMN